MEVDDIEMSSSAASEALNHAMLAKDYKRARKLLEEDAYFDGTLEEAFQCVLRHYSAKGMKIMPVDKADIKKGPTYLARMGSRVFCSGAYNLRDEGWSLYYEHVFYPLDEIDEIQEIQIIK